MRGTIQNLKEVLALTTDGSVACDAMNALTKHAKKGNVEAKKVLADYVHTGRVNHMRTFACACLMRVVGPGDSEFVAIFEQGLLDPSTRYWSIAGYISIVGRTAYQPLTKIAGDKSLPLEDRSHAIKCLAAFSKQPFDRQLPSDPGQWNESDLRLTEVAVWAKGGYPDGQGYAAPGRHDALDSPKTDFEVIVSRLDRKLAKKRHDDQDLAEPTDWLAVADPDDIRRITARWKLPSLYLDFLTRFSPIRVIIEGPEFYNPFQLFGASELFAAQDGYSYNPVEQSPIEDWPADLVVIASHGGDPFVLDLSRSNGTDAPVLTAEHGMGEWDFVEEASSFSDFLRELAK